MMMYMVDRGDCHSIERGDDHISMRDARDAGHFEVTNTNCNLRFVSIYMWEFYITQSITYQPYS